MIKDIYEKTSEMNELLKSQLNEFELFNLSYLLANIPKDKDKDRFKEFKEFWFDHFSERFDLSKEDKIYLWIMAFFIIASNNKMPNIYDLKFISNLTKKSLKKSNF